MPGWNGWTGNCEPSHGLGRRRGDPRAALASGILQARVCVVPGDRPPDTDGLRWRAELPLAGDGQRRSAIDGVGSLEMRRQNHREVAGLGVHVTRQGLLAPAILWKRSAGHRLRAERGAVAMTRLFGTDGIRGLAVTWTAWARIVMSNC